MELHHIDGPGQNVNRKKQIRFTAFRTKNRRISNIEPQNVEGRNWCLYFNKTERSDSTLQYSIFKILRFCGSLSKPGTRNSQPATRNPL